MRLGIGQFNSANPEYLQFAKQLGIQDVLLNTASLPSVKGTWTLRDLVKLRLSIEAHGLTLAALENVPTDFYDHIMLGGPERDRQIENMITTIRNMARAGIPRFGYHWMPSHVWRTHHVMLAGDASATAFDNEIAKKFPLTHGKEYSEEEMWESFEDWLKIITPVAEEEGIRLGVHPCDPPVETLGGIPNLFRSFDSYKRLVETVDSPSNMIEFCQGTFSEMEDAKGDGIYEMIDYFAARKKILYVHFRNVSGTVPKFNEEYINTGYVDMKRAVKIYAKHGYDSFFIDDHVPSAPGDTPWGHRSRAFASGYIQGLIECTT
jgi:mannonate dehydratase